jgi:hypothetical protein
MEGHARETGVATEIQISHIVITCRVRATFDSGITLDLLDLGKIRFNNTLKSVMFKFIPLM